MCNTKVSVAFWDNKIYDPDNYNIFWSNNAKMCRAKYGDENTIMGFNFFQNAF